MIAPSHFPLKDKFNRFCDRQWLKLRGERGQFLDAVSDGDLDTVKEIVGIFPDAVSWDSGRSQKGYGGVWRDSIPVIIAMNFSNNPRLLEFLLDHGADIDKRSKTGETALRLAVCNWRQDMLDILIDRGADPDLANNEGRTARQTAHRFSALHADSHGHPPEWFAAYFDRKLEERAKMVLNAEGTQKPVRIGRPFRFRKR